MHAPKRYIIFSNLDPDGWMLLYDCDTLKQAHTYIDKYLKDVPWQYVLTQTLELKGYD